MQPLAPAEYRRTPEMKEKVEASAVDLEAGIGETLYRGSREDAAPSVFLSSPPPPPDPPPPPPQLPSLWDEEGAVTPASATAMLGSLARPFRLPFISPTPPDHPPPPPQLPSLWDEEGAAKGGTVTPASPTAMLGSLAGCLSRTVRPQPPAPRVSPGVRRRRGPARDGSVAAW